MPVGFSADHSNLRRVLESIATEHQGRNVGAQIAAIRKLGEEFNHSITLVADVADASPSEGQLNCFMFALGMQHPPPLAAKILRRFDHVYPGAEFVSWLLSVELVERHSGGTLNGDIVLYFAGVPKHAGIWDQGWVMSKWGLGHVWRHKPLEVPASYGDTFRIFQGLAANVAWRRFFEYATAKLGTETIEMLEEADA